MSLTKICKDFDIPVLSCPPEKRKLFGVSSTGTGCAAVLNGKPYILCDDSRPREELRYTIAHELGHLTFRADSGEYPPYMETEANIFAAVLLAGDVFDGARALGGAYERAANL